MLTDANGNPLVDEEALPDLRTFDLVELTALTSALLQVLVTIHGPEVIQLVALRAEQVEEALRAVVEVAE